MQCPHCNKTILKPFKLENELPAMGCCQCKSALLSVLSYRQWIERHPVEAAVFFEECKSVKIKDATPSLICPKCSSVMTAYEILSFKDTHIHLCSWCFEIWVDSAEWHLIRQLEIQQKLPEKFFIPFNEHPFQDTVTVVNSRHIEDLLGPDYSDIKILKKWIDKHPQKSTIISFLNDHNSSV